MSAQIVQAFLDHTRRDPGRPAIGAGANPMHARRAVAAEAMRIAAWLDERAPEGATVIAVGSSGPGFWAATLAILGTGRRLLPVSLVTAGPELRSPIDSHAIEPESLARAPARGDASTTRSDFGAAAIILHDAMTDGGANDGASSLSASALPVMRAFDERAPSRAGGLDADGERLGRGADASLLLRSSGTTGRARVVLRDSAALDRVAITLAQVLGVDDADTIASHLPMQHSYGFEHTVLLPMLTGARVRVMDRFAPDHLFASLRHDATVLPTVPVILQALAEMSPGGDAPAAPTAGAGLPAMESAPRAEGALAPPHHRLRVVVSAGSPLPPAVRARFESTWGVAVRNLYGASELGTIAVTATPPGDGDRVVPGVSIRVCDPEIEDRLVECGPGEVGELCVRSDAMFRGYLDADGTLDRRRIVEGHLRTGDAGSMDEAGRLTLRGRLRLQLDVGGLKVEPEAIESVLQEHPLVREAVVVALPMSDTLTRLRAVVVRRGAASPDDASTLRAFLRERVAPHEVPRVIDFVDELPRSASGKVLRGVV